MKNRFNINSTAFIFLTSAYFAFILNVKFWRFAFEKISIDNAGTAFFVMTLPFFIFVPLFWFFCLIVVPRIAKPAVILLLFLSAASSYALSNLGVVINSDMIRNIAETNVRETADLFTWNAFFYVLAAGGLPAAAVCMTRIEFSPFKKELRRRLTFFLTGLAVLGVFGAVSYKEYASFGRNNRQVRHYINTFNYIYAVARYYQRSRSADRKFVVLDESPRIKPRKSPEKRVVVLVVGETARAQNFSLYGYKKETNPLLAQNKEIIVFKDVSSCGTATAVSLPCMFSVLPKKDFDVTDANFTQNLLDIAQSAGYDVEWKDNDDGCKKVCNRVKTIDAKTGNKKPFCFGDYCHDGILIDGLDERLASVEKDTLIVLHAMGSHGPTYYKRYPDAFKRFNPTCDTANLQDCPREQIVNTYDNTIAYTDHVIASVIEVLKRHPELQSSMLYMSDHGESLGENNIYLHGLPYAFAPDYQKKVPMILWLSDSLKQSAALNASCLKQKAEKESFSHDNYFHSVLRLLGVQTTAYDAKLDVFDGCGV